MKKFIYCIVKCSIRLDDLDSKDKVYYESYNKALENFNESVNEIHREEDIEILEYSVYYVKYKCKEDINNKWVYTIQMKEIQVII